MQFTYYFLGFLANPLILLYSPNDLGAHFLFVLTISNTAFSLLLTVLFTNIHHQSVRIFTKRLITFFPIVFIFAWIVDRSIALAMIYPYSLLVSDYYASQSLSQKLLKVYRVGLILSAIVVVLNQDYYTHLLVVRSIVIILLSIVISHTENEVHRLNIKSTKYFLLQTYIFYSGSLLLISYLNLLEPDQNKWWYVSIQMSLALILKVIDFATRKDVVISRLAVCAVSLLSILIIGGMASVSFNATYLLIYFISFIGLLRLLGEYVDD